MTIFGGLVAVAVVVALVLILLNRPGGGDDVSDITIAAERDPSIPASGRILGQADAPVKVIEYGDYQCPACGIFARMMEPQLVQDYVATGKISFEYRDWAFIGPDSTRAAEAAFCAQDQGKFWQFHDTLFQNQRGENRGDYSDARLKEMARQMGLDMDAFNACYDGGKYEDAVKASYQEGQNLGINGTPTFVINGQVLKGWDGSYAALKAAIDQALGQ